MRQSKFYWKSAVCRCRERRFLRRRPVISAFFAVGRRRHPGHIPPAGDRLCFWAETSVLSSIPSPLSLPLRYPRNVAAVTVAAAAVAGVAWLILRRSRPSAEEIERQRRELLATTGRITDGSITDVPAAGGSPLIIVYNYRIAGVSYECAQDVTALADQVRDVRADLPIQVRYDMHNPGNSIVIAESWSGLRLSPHPQEHGLR